MDLVVVCYELARSFSGDERFGLTSQLQRAAASVPANIAEGHGRGTSKAFLNHLWIANGSLSEVETHLLIAERLAYLTPTQLEPAMTLSSQIGRTLIGLRRSVEEKLA